jgi:hypothetical protein
MKKILMSLLFVTVLFSCSTPEDEVKTAVTGFYNALNSMEFEKAMPYASEATQQTLSMMMAFAGQMEGQEIPQVSFEVTEVAIDGDTATATVVSTVEGQTSEEPVSLVNEGGKWLVDLPKEMPGGDAMEFDKSLEEPIEETNDETME